MKKVVIKISDEKYVELEIAAREQGLTVEEAAEDGVCMFLSEHEAAKYVKIPGLNKTLEAILGPSNVVSFYDASYHKTEGEHY